MVTAVILPTQVSSFSDRFKFKDDPFNCNREHCDIYAKLTSFSIELPWKFCLVRISRRKDCPSHECQEAEGNKNKKKSQEIKTIVLKVCHLLVYSESHGVNRPFPSYLKPLFQSEAWCTTIHMKMSLICMWMKSHFHMKG